MFPVKHTVIYTFFAITSVQNTCFCSVFNALASKNPAKSCYVQFFFHFWPFFHCRKATKMTQNSISIPSCAQTPKNPRKMSKTPPYSGLGAKPFLGSGLGAKPFLGPPPPAKADIATAILTNVIEHLVLLLPPNKHAFTAKAVWADFLAFVKPGTAPNDKPAYLCVWFSMVFFTSRVEIMLKSLQQPLADLSIWTIYIIYTMICIYLFVVQQVAPSTGQYQWVAVLEGGRGRCSVRRSKTSSDDSSWRPSAFFVACNGDMVGYWEIIFRYWILPITWTYGDDAIHVEKRGFFFCTAKVWNMCIPTNWIMVAKKILGMANQKSGSSKIFHGRCSRKWLHIVISCYIMLYRPPGFFVHTYFIIFIPLIFILKKKLLMYWVHTPSIGFWLLVPQLSGFMAGRCSSLPTVGTWKKRNGMRVTGSAKNDVFLYPKMIL